MSDPTRLDLNRTYTLNEAARLTGLSVDALRQRAKRGKLETVKGNDGLVHVRLTTADLDAIKSSQGEQTDLTESSRLDTSDQTIRALQDDGASLREALSREQHRADSAEAGQAEARARADQVATERDQARQEREDARIAAARAEGEAGALRDALADARRPFWRHWLG